MSNTISYNPMTLCQLSSRKCLERLSKEESVHKIESMGYLDILTVVGTTEILGKGGISLSMYEDHRTDKVEKSLPCCVYKILEREVPIFSWKKEMLE
ncbi:hypothetical protein, partial [Candidatus Ichthyocystis hellenicum]|uniref:hypothetical protein n=1 Tax=Candidatus Ichthyocystis hellenicum TaxID=1561003 RepID=UPI001111D5C5